MAETRVSKPIKNQEILDSLINITADQITKSYVMELFGDFDGKRKCSQYDTLVIPPGKIIIGGKPNKNSFVTTAGLYLLIQYKTKAYL